MNSPPRHVLVLGGLSQSLVNFRGPIIRALLGRGYRVTAVAGNYDAEVAAVLNRWGANYVSLPLARSGLNPLSDLVFLLSLASLMRRIKPDIFFGYTIKPVTLGLLAARLARVPRRFAMVTGLGYAFTEGFELKRRFVRLAARFLYRKALRHAHATIFQNPDDEAYFRQSILAAGSVTAVVGGSGVDLSHYSPTPLPPGPVNFLMISRLLRDKGVVEFAHAAKMVRKINDSARFVLVGPPDPSPDSITEAEVQAWVADGAIEYKGAVADIRPEMAACHVYVLPSYREGTPRTVLEAMAMGRPIITTDTPGCRETIDKAGANGILVPPRNAEALAEAALQLMAVSKERLEEMASCSSRLVRERFDVHLVTADILRVVCAD